MKLLELFKKNKKEELQISLVEELAITEDQETQETEQEQAEDQRENNEQNDISKQLALLMGTDEATLKKEFVEYNVKKFLSLVGKAVVRSEALEEDVKGIYMHANDLYLGGVMTSPVYLSACAKLQKKKGRTFDVGAIVDFPFGESTFQSKIHAVKACKKAKMDFCVTTIPTMLIGKENAKLFKKQTKKFVNAFNKKGGIAVNASDLAVEDLKRVSKLLAKSKAQSFTMLFGDTPIEEITQKIIAVGGVIGEKKLFVLANVETTQAITELKKLGVDRVFTPFAEQIAKEVLQTFGIKDIKLY